MDVADILSGAADAIDRLGHCKGDYTNGEGNVCAVGAMRVAAHGDPTQAPKKGDLILAANRLLAMAVSGNDCTAEVPAWNDLPCRTKDEVTSMFRAVAATERARSATEFSPQVEQPQVAEVA